MKVQQVLNTIGFAAILLLAAIPARPAAAVVVLDMPSPPGRPAPAISTDDASSAASANPAAADNPYAENSPDPGAIAFTRYTSGRYYPTSRYGRFGRYPHGNSWYDDSWYYGYPWGGWGWGWGWGWPWIGCTNFVGVGTIQSPAFSGPINNFRHFKYWSN